MSAQSSREPEALHHVLGYAEHGLHAFPCGADKKPLTPHGFKDATTDPDTLRAWWTRWPDAMIGLVMGAKSGVSAIDPDVPKAPGDPHGPTEWRNLVKRHGGISATQTHTTPSGGLHILFRFDPARPVTNKAGALAALNIDVRGEGGYVIAPGSRLPDGRRYELADSFDYGIFADAAPWLLDMIEKRPQREEPPPAAPHENVTPFPGMYDRYVASALDKECESVAQAGPAVATMR